jgi:polysaccharide biosynthesis/export protein
LRRKRFRFFPVVRRFNGDASVSWRSIARTKLKLKTIGSRNGGAMPGGDTLKASNLCPMLTLTCLMFVGTTAIAADDGTKKSSAEQDMQDEVYHLGPGDEIKVHQSNAEELDGRAARIDDMGYATLPLVGRIKLGGTTLEQAESLLASRLSHLLVNPQPVVSISEYRSQPVSVLGAVNNPGVLQLQGRKTLMEMLSLGGGLRQDAGGEVVITRRLGYGRVPVSNESVDPSGRFSTARIDAAGLVKGTNPGDNIVILPQDVISVPGSELIYVTGDVHKPGSFPLRDSNGISVLQAISLAEGLGPQASAKNAKIFRVRGGDQEKDEIRVDVSRILAGESRDFKMKPRDILFIPDSASKKAGYRAAEAAIQAVTGIAIWHR